MGLKLGQGLGKDEDKFKPFQVFAIKKQNNLHLNTTLLFDKALECKDADVWKEGLSYRTVTIMSLLWMAAVSSKEGVAGLRVWLCFFS